MAGSPLLHAPRITPPHAPLPPQVSPQHVEDYVTTIATAAKQRKVTVIGDGYEIGPMLGRGGTSVVFESSHPEYEGPLAIKVLTDPRLHGARSFAAIYEQARRIADLTSPHVVRTIDAGRLDTGEPYVVMERLEGMDLADYIRERGALPCEEAIRLVDQVCTGLAEAHAVGIVHEDLKPANLVLRTVDDEPWVTIIDFGMTVPRSEDPAERLVTGSPGYASPEQLWGKTDIDGRADVWALGILLYELVTGTRLFVATTLAEAREIITRPIPMMASPHGEVPAALEAIVHRCTALDREQRYASVADLAAALATLGAGAVDVDVPMTVDTVTEATDTAIDDAPPSHIPLPTARSVSIPAIPPAAPVSANVIVASSASIAIAPKASRNVPTVASQAKVEAEIAAFLAASKPARWRQWKHWRVVGLVALGPICALITMTIVRVALDSSFMKHSDKPVEAALR